MKKIETLEELHQLEIGILDAFAEFCNENGIKYSLGAGTMIGAVRHHGFIPWDDDIDIFMMRADYDLFLEKAEQKELLRNRYKVLPPEASAYSFTKIIDTKTYLHDFGKKEKYAIGVWIDVFPVDYGYDSPQKNYKLIKKQLRRMKFRIYCCNPKGSSFLHTLVKKPLVFTMNLLGMNTEYWIRKCREFPILPKSPYAGTMIWPSNNKDVYPAEFFEGYTELTFEGKKYMSFARYDDLLTWRYGDYMQLPPVEQRCTHSIEAFYL